MGRANESGMMVNFLSRPTVIIANPTGTDDSICPLPDNMGLVGENLPAFYTPPLSATVMG